MVRAIRERYEPLIEEHSARHSLRPALVRAVIQVESGFNPRARSVKGAMGLMQLMPATADQFGVKNPFNPEENVRAGVTYLRQLLDRYYGKGGYTLQPARDPGGLTSAMRAYFKGDIGAIDRLPVDESAGTPFQRSVWRALRKIKSGKTISYAELARRIGKPKAVRAAGLANGQNPISIVVPCHRVVAATGLGSYGSLGVEYKQRLLELEGVAL